MNILLATEYPVPAYRAALHTAAPAATIIDVSVKFPLKCPWERVAGLLLTGGEDVDPGVYGEQRTPACGNSNIIRDLFEVSLVKSARAWRVPILGICRGHQLLAAASGGALAQHIDGHAIGGEVAHSITYRPAGQQAKRLYVNSRHHQAVLRPAFDMQAIGFAPDGTVEACAGAGGLLHSVQWHPEDLPGHGWIFRQFCAAAAARGAA